jgi:CheY-like chemotaxis protein
MIRYRILLVDDEPAFTRVIKRYLESTGKYEVRTENDATKVMAAAREFRPHLVLLDVVMPKTDGGEIAAQMREDEQLKRVEIVFLTATVSRSEVRRQPVVPGGPTFLAKPVAAEDVIRCIEEKLRLAA